VPNTLITGYLFSAHSMENVLLLDNPSSLWLISTVIISCLGQKVVLTNTTTLCWCENLYIC